MIDIGVIKTVPLESIILGERVRQELGDIEGLEQSMKESGLIQPLAAKDNKDSTYTLIAGGRRFTVLKKNNVPNVHIRIYDDSISELELKVLEKSENFFRKDFEYFEMDRIIREITELQQSIHGKKAPGPNTSGWSLEDTGELVGISKASVSLAIQRDEVRQQFPELFTNCKTQQDASKIVNMMKETIINAQMAKAIEENKTNGVVDRLSKSYILGDCLKNISKLPDGIFHMVEIDPPYGIDLHRQKKSNELTNPIKDAYNEIDVKDYRQFIKTLLSLCYNKMTENSWLIFWFAPEPWFEDIYELIKSTGFETFRMCGIWTKPAGQSKHPEVYLSNTYEMFFYAWKGRPALNKQGRSNNFQFPPIPNQSKTHPTERPIELMQEIYDTFLFKGSRILIPFLGSGNGLIAGENLGMPAIGFELEKQYRDSFIVKISKMFK